MRDASAAPRRLPLHLLETDLCVRRGVGDRKLDQHVDRALLETAEEARLPVVPAAGWKRGITAPLQIHETHGSDAVGDGAVR